MLGYYTIPLYSDATLTEHVNNLYIPIISREAADNPTPYETTILNGATVSGYTGGRSRWGTSFKTMIYNSDMGMWNNGGTTSANFFNRLPSRALKSAYQGLMRQHINDLVVPGAYAQGQLTNKFNFRRLAYLALEDNAPIFLYLKNGNYIKVIKDERTDFISGTIQFFKSTGSQIGGTSTSIITIIALKPPTGTPSTTYAMGESNLISMDSMKSFCDSYGLNNFGSDSFMCWHLYDDYTDLSLSQQMPYLCWVDGMKVTDRSSSAIRESYGVGTWITGSTMGSFAVPVTGYNFFFEFLGIKGVPTIDEDIKNIGGEYKENTEDADNTYPGGGEDKNTYPEDGESGKGTFDNTNDEVDFPPMPLWDATSTGFISMWNPTITEISALYGFLWDSDISTTLKKLFLEPMEAIISLAFFPVDPTNFPNKRNVTIGHVDTEIQMYAVQKQFVDFDFGTLKIDEYYGAAWDYSPYTQASIYLPYIGTQSLDIDDVMNGTLHLKYRIDLLSGMCSAMLRVDRSRDGLQAVIYTWQGNCAMQVPITAGSAREFLNSIIQLGAMAGVSLMQPLSGAIDASMHKSEDNYSSSAMGNNWINPTVASFSALNVLGQKVRVQRGGRVDANAGVMSPQSAYIILNRPISAIPKGWNQYAGYPSLKIKNLSTQKGYTEIAYIKLNNLEATAEEITELDRMLKGGVMI